MRPERKGQDKVRAGGTCRWGRGSRHVPTPTPGLGAREPRAEPPPVASCARPGAHRRSGRGARASGRGLTHIPGGSALRDSRRRGERCPSVSLRTGTRAQPCLSGNAAADADPARGAERSRGGGARGAGAAGEARAGRRGSGPRRVSVLGGPRTSTASARLARPPPPVPAPAAAAPRTPPRAWARSLPPLLSRDPLGISRKNVYCERKRAKRTKTRGGGGNSEGDSRRSSFAGSRTWSPPLPSPVAPASMV